MKILLDECVDRRLARDISGHEVRTAQEMGWAAVKNGELLILASQRFDVFVTADRNLIFQQNIGKLPIAVLVLHGRTNRLADLKPLIPKLLAALENLQRGVTAVT